MVCGCCHEKSIDLDPVQKEERFAFWFAGFCVGPDTVNGVFWAAAILAYANMDSTCGVNPYDGLTSGADGKMCSSNTLWNDTLFLSLGGTECIKNVGLQVGYHNLQTTECQSAMDAYRVLEPTYTCNCSNAPYALLGGTGGQRPSNVLTVASIITNVVLAVILPFLGTWADMRPHRRKLFFFSGMLMAVFTCLGSIMAPNMIWAIGLTFTVLAALFFEFSFVGLGPYLPEICPDDQSKGKISGLRQVGSLGSQLIFGIIVFGIATVALPGGTSDQISTAIIGNTIAFVWISCLLPLSYKSLRPRPASNETTRGVCVASVGQLCSTFRAAKRYRNTFLYLFMHFCSASAVGSVISQLPTYGFVQLQLTSFQITVITLVILVAAIPSAFVYSFVCVKRVKPKVIQFCTYLWLLTVLIVFPLSVTAPGQFVLGVIAGLCIGIGFGLFYSVEYANFTKMVPVNQKAEFIALYAVFSYVPRFIPPLVYASVVHALNDHQIAFMTLAIYLTISFGFFFCIDYEQGEIDANNGAGDKVASDSKVELGEERKVEEERRVLEEDTV